MEIKDKYIKYKKKYLKEKNKNMKMYGGSSNLKADNELEPYEYEPDSDDEGEFEETNFIGHLEKLVVAINDVNTSDRLIFVYKHIKLEIDRMISYMVKRVIDGFCKLDLVEQLNAETKDEIIKATNIKKKSKSNEIEWTRSVAESYGQCLRAIVIPPEDRGKIADAINEASVKNLVFSPDQGQVTKEEREEYYRKQHEDEISRINALYNNSLQLLTRPPISSSTQTLIDQYNKDRKESIKIRGEFEPDKLEENLSQMGW